MLFLKILRLSYSRIFLSILFQSITVEGKKEFLKKIMSHFKRKNIFDVSARHRNSIEEVGRRLLVKDLMKIREFSMPSSFFARDSNINSRKSFSLEVPQRSRYCKR